MILVQNKKTQKHLQFAQTLVHVLKSTRNSNLKKVQCIIFSAAPLNSLHLQSNQKNNNK